MKKFFLLFAALTCVMSVWANYNVLAVHLTDGTQVNVALNESLRLTFDGDDMIADDGVVNLAFPKNTIAHFDHFTDPGAVKDLLGDASYDFTGDEIHFYSLPAGSNVALYDAAGLCVASANAEGNLTLPLQGLKAGIYIVIFNNNSFKISVK